MRVFFLKILRCHTLVLHVCEITILMDIIHHPLSQGQILMTT